MCAGGGEGGKDSRVVVGGEASRWPRRRKEECSTKKIILPASLFLVLSLLMFYTCSSSSQPMPRNQTRRKTTEIKHLEIDLSVVGSDFGDRERSDIGSVLASNGGSSLLGGHELGDLDEKERKLSQ